MTFRKSTRYALYAALEMARSERGAQVPVARVAERYGIPVAVLAKVFQQLVRAGIAVGTRGTRGGYTLALPPAELTVLDVIEAFEPSPASDRCLLADDREETCEDHGVCRLGKLFAEVDELARCTYASVTLATLAGNRPRQDSKLRIVT